MEFKGLTRQEIEYRKQNNLVNTYKDPTKITLLGIIEKNVFTFFNLIISILAFLVFSVKAYRNSLFILAALINMAIAIYQEYKAKRILEKLSLLHKDKVCVIREGKETYIDPSEIVQDDLLHLHSGNEIVCDCVVVQGNLEVNESQLTGEADVILKKEGETVYSGSYIISGSAILQVIHIKDENLVNIILNKAKEVKKRKSIIMDNIDSILKIISILVFPLGGLLFCSQYFVNHSSYADAIIGTVAGISGMIPEGLVLLTSMTLALSVIEISKHQTLIHDLYSIETLAHVDTLCLDKTGTITQGDMQVDKIYPLDDELDVYQKACQLVSVLDDHNATFNSLKNYFNQPYKSYAPLQVIPFSSERKYSGAVFENETLLLGAFEYLFNDSYKNYRQIASQYTTTGMRVLVLARSKQQMKDYILPDDLTPIAFISIFDQIRPNVKETIEYMHKQNIKTKIISGDAIDTLMIICNKIGLENTKGIDLSLVTDKQLKEAVLHYDVFGRVKPEQKKQIIEILQDEGHVVSMTGDGVNDVMALKQADFSIAMQNGSEATKQVSSIILLDNDFTHLPTVLDEGRKVIHHIQNASSMFLTKTLLSVLLTFFVIISTSQYPFKPIQLTFISSLTIGIPTFLLTLEKDFSIVKEDYLPFVLSKSIYGSLLIFIQLALIKTFCVICHLNFDVLSTLSFLMTTISMLLLIKNIYPLNTKYRKLVFHGILLFVALFIFSTSSFINFVRIDLKSMILILVLIAMNLYFDRLFQTLTSKFSSFIEKHERQIHR